MKSVYITRLSKYLPNRPVSNDEMEKYLGMIGGMPSKAKRLILGKNKITCRYYAMDEQGSATHSNAQMTALAVKDLCCPLVSLNDMRLLCCGTSSPDQLIPSHAAMVHGMLGNGNMEIASFSGACCSGIQALKYGCLSVLSGNTDNAVCTGSERVSSWMRSENYCTGNTEDTSRLENDGYVAFEKEFLRWMLSDGAGAALLQDAPGDGLNLRIDWIEVTSFADRYETCMYAGGEKLSDGTLKGWHEYDPDEWKNNALLALHQDVRLLSENIVNLGRDYYAQVSKKHGLDIREISYFLPHLSSEFFRDLIMASLEKAGLDIPAEKWFTNLTSVGNVGAASPYLMLEELCRTGRLNKGERILMMVPESARFSYSFCLFTVC